jgi:hypothetical protein
VSGPGAYILRDDRPELARAYDRSGQVDSAVAIHERYVHARALFRSELDAFELAYAYRRLAALYEERSDFANAATYQRRLAELWHGGDDRQRLVPDSAERHATRLEGLGPRDPF